MPEKDEFFYANYFIQPCFKKLIKIQIIILYSNGIIPSFYMWFLKMFFMF